MFPKNKSLVLILLALLFGLLAACSSGETDTEPTAEPTQEAAEVPTAEPTPVADEAWARIKSNGRLVVGTAADYPPFEYYTDNFQLEGFDIALIRALGEELGLIVDIQDMAFDGLGDALAVSQIDVAISALSITPQREALADFTNVYYVGEDAVLAATGSNIGPIREPGDLAGYKVGVQGRTIYEDWVEETLIEPSLMPEENLFAYGTAEQAVTDLVAGRVDLVILDALPAEVAEGYFDVEIVGQGLNRQRFAIAHLQNEPELQKALNDALTALQNSGVLSDLANEYLNLSELPPIEPGEPVEPEPGPDECVDASKFVGDLNLDDNNMTTPPIMQPGQAFRKGWRMQNVGTCTWDNTYKLVFAGGNVSTANMGGTQVPVQGTVAPGQTFDFWVDLVAPLAPGTYQGFWEMRTGNNDAFGQRVWVGIRVPGAPTPVPLPTQTPSPSINFTVDRTQINQGECVKFTWSVENIQAVWFFPNGEDFNKYPATGQGSSTQCPNQTTTYNLRVQYRDGSVEVRQITVFVEPSNAAPKIVNFSVNPPSVNVNQCVQIQWRVEGNVNKVVIRRDNIILWDGAPLSSTMNDCPTSAGFAVYVIEAAGPTGTARLQQNVSVLE